MGLYYNSFIPQLSAKFTYGYSLAWGKKTIYFFL